MNTPRDAILLAFLLGIPVAHAELRLQLDPSARALSRDSARERVAVWIENTGAESVPTLGGTLHFQIEEGRDTSAGPRIVGLALPDQVDSLFRTDNASLTLIPTGPRLWSAVVITQPESLPIEVWIPPFQRLAIATLDLDTRGVSGEASTWRLKMASTQQGDSVLDQVDPEDRAMVSTLLPVATDLTLALERPLDSLGPKVAVLGDGRIAISFPAPVSGRGRLERSTALEGQPWHPVEDSPVVSDSAWHWQLPPAGPESQAFYRIVTTP
jgi:hypothetical protein